MFSFQGRSKLQVDPRQETFVRHLDDSSYLAQRGGIRVSRQHRQEDQNRRRLEATFHPRNAKGNYDWNALPKGLYLIEWRAGGKRRRESAGVTAAQALEAQRRKRHELEGRKLGVPGFELAGQTAKTPRALHVAVHKDLAQIEALKKPNTHRKYEAVLERFVEFFRDKESIDQIGVDDLTRYIIALKKDHNLGANTVLHNAIIVAQFFKRHGRGGITRGLQLPERITPLPREYRTADLAKFFKAADDSDRVLFSTFC